jgi:hypothetical protein
VNEWLLFAVHFAVVSYVELRCLQRTEKRLGVAVGALHEVARPDQAFPKQFARHVLRDLGEIQEQPDA